MSEGPITNYSTNRLWMILVIGFIISLFIGWLVSFPIIQLSSIDLLMIFIYSFLVPLLVTFVGFYLGWKIKKNIVRYQTTIEVRKETIKIKVDEYKNFLNEYNRQHFSFAAVGRIWYYFVPIIQICINIGIPFYTFQINPQIVTFIPLITGLNFAIIWSISLYGGFRSSSNSASRDFTLPLVREAAKLAQKQKSVEGTSEVSIVMDYAEIGGFRSYDNPRVVIRVEGLEKAGYIESISEEMSSVSRILAVLYETDNYPQTVWWWLSRDRNFRKYVGSDDDGYYVKYPVPTNITHIGVKDVKLLTQNAVAIIIREYIRLNGTSKQLLDILEKLNVEKP